MQLLMSTYYGSLYASDGGVLETPVILVEGLQIGVKWKL